MHNHNLFMVILYSTHRITTILKWYFILKKGFIFTQNTVLLILLTPQISINVFHVPRIAAVVCTCVCISVHKHWFLQTDWPLIPNVFAPLLSGDFIHSWPQALSDSSLGCSAHEPMNGFCLTARSRGHTRHSHSCCIEKSCVTFSVVPVWSQLGTACFMSDWDIIGFPFFKWAPVRLEGIGPRENWKLDSAIARNLFLYRSVSGCQKWLVNRVDLSVFIWWTLHQTNVFL